MLFGEGRKDEILVRYRQKTSLGLSTFGDASSPECAGSDCDLGLNHLVARAFRILTRIEKADYSSSLIILQHDKISHWHDQRHNYNYGRRVLPPHARQEDASDQNRKVGQGCTEIRLEHYQRGRHGH